MDRQRNSKRIWIFLAIAFGIPWIADLAIYLTGKIKEDPLQWASMANAIAIFTPALANIATRLITREGFKHLWLRPNFKRGWPFYLAAWLLPLLAVSVGALIFYVFFPQYFDQGLSGIRTVGASLPPVANAANPWMGLLFFVLYFQVVGLLINGIVSMGEDFGWRGYLLPKLVKHFSAGGRSSAFAGRAAALLVGVIWGVWHGPLFFLASFAGAPGPNLLAYIIFTTALSVLLSWVTLRSGSAWPASIGHGTVNSTSVLPSLLLKGGDLPLLGPAPTGLIGGLGYVILALVLLLSRKAFAGEDEGLVEAGPAAAEVFEQGGNG